MCDLLRLSFSQGRSFCGGKQCGVKVPASHVLFRKMRLCTRAQHHDQNCCALISKSNAGVRGSMPGLTLWLSSRFEQSVLRCLAAGLRTFPVPKPLQRRQTQVQPNPTQMLAQALSCPAAYSSPVHHTLSSLPWILTLLILFVT